MINNENLDKLIELVKNLEENEIEELNEALEEFKKANSLKAEQEKINQLKEELASLEDKLSKKENPFDVGMKDEAYYGRGFEAIGVSERWDAFDLRTFVPCKDKSIVEERQKRGYLNALLEKFAYENDAVVTEGMWKDDYIYKYYFCYDFDSQMYTTTYTLFSKSLSEIYFTSEEVCQRAIDEIVIPFMEDKK